MPTNPDTGRPGGTRRLAVDLELDQHKALRRAALDHDVTVADLVRSLVNDYLERGAPTIPDQVRRRG